MRTAKLWTIAVTFGLLLAFQLDVSAQEPAGKELELLSGRPLGIYYWGDRLDLRAKINNLTDSGQTYQLDYEVYDFEGNRVCSGKGEEKVPASASKEIRLAVDPEVYPSKSHPKKPFTSYFIVYATLTRPGATATAQTSFGFILPNKTGLDDESPFGVMLWTEPKDQRGILLYRDAGIKVICTNPSYAGPIPQLFAENYICAQMDIWAQAFRDSASARAHKGKSNPLIPSLSDQVRSKGPIAGRFVSNFWEVDLRQLPQTYGLNAKYFYEAAKRGNPRASVGSGGFACSNTAYTELMLLNGGAGYFDFAVYMGYFSPSPPERSGLIDEFDALKAIFKRYKMPNTQVWFSEWSYFDHLNLERPELGSQWIHSGVSRDLISPYMVREALVCLAAGATKIYPNHMFRVSDKPLREKYGHAMTGCSSHRYDSTPLPLYFAWSVMTRNIEGKVFKGMIDCGPGVYCLRFEAVKDSYKSLGSTPCVIALWSEYGARPVSLQVGQKSVDVLNFVGDARQLQTLDGIVTVCATPRPLYLLLDARSSASVKYVREPVIEPVDSQCEVVYGEAGEVVVGFRVRNPSNKDLQGRLVFEGPNWCECEPGEAEVKIDAGRSGVARFNVKVPEGNHDRVDYEFADLVRRAEHYITVGLLDEEGRQIGVSRVPLVVREPLEVRIRPLLKQKSDQETPGLVVWIRNRSSVAKKGTVEIRTKAKLEITPHLQPFAVGPGKEIVGTFNVRGAAGGGDAGGGGQRIHLGGYDQSATGYYYSFGIGEGYVVEVVVKCEDGAEERQSRGFAFFPCVHAKRPPRIDGREDDWRDAVWFKVNPEGRANGLPYFADVHSGNKENMGMYFKGAPDLSARWAAMWDEKNLYLFFRVFDDVFHQPFDKNMLWNGDSIRLAIDPEPDKTDAGIQPVPRDPSSFLTFDVGLTRAGPQLYRMHYGCGKGPGIVQSARVSIAKLDDGLAYELAIPWSELGALRPQKGGWMQMSINFDDSDGFGRKTWIPWFGGLGNIAREPRLMGDVHFVE